MEDTNSRFFKAGPIISYKKRLLQLIQNNIPHNFRRVIMKKFLRKLSQRLNILLFKRNFKRREIAIRVCKIFLRSSLSELAYFHLFS